VSFAIQPALAITGQHFKQRRALAMGVVASGSSIGGVCLPIMFSRIVPKIGFSWSIRVAALLFLCSFLVAICISSDKRASKTTTRVVPRHLLDFNGFKDPRYIALAIGSFVANLGLYVPYYYIGGSGYHLHQMAAYCRNRALYG
jgi:MFS family permease